MNVDESYFEIKRTLNPSRGYDDAQEGESFGMKLTLFSFNSWLAGRSCKTSSTRFLRVSKSGCQDVVNEKQN